MHLIVIKILVAVFLVITLVFISERNSKLGGLIIGLPLGTGIMVFFYGLEQGVDFVVKAAPFGISGIVSTVFFGIGFYLGGKTFKNSAFFNAFVAYFVGLAFYLLSSFFLFYINKNIIEINLFIALIMIALSLVVSSIFYSNVIVKKRTNIRKFKFPVLIFRALFVIAVVLTITGIAKIIGAEWAGLIASYPTTVSPLLIILAYSYKDEIYPILLKTMSYSISTLAVFYIVVMFIFPAFGIYYGIVVAYVICFVYLFLLNFIQSKLFSNYRKPAKPISNVH